MAKYKEYASFDLPTLEKEIRKYWEDNNIFEQSIKERENCPNYIFYEGPPSANGMPGIHHVMARTIKDMVCRYKTQKGYKVARKAGWDTHGLPVEISVEQTLGITKEDIGSTISVEDYNKTCRKEVMKFKDKWEELTSIMGYWVNLEEAYITFDNKYIETVWWLLSQLHKKGLLYKGYTIQPFSPAAGTGLSSHELNMPGCYRDVKDNTVVAQFKVKDTENDYFLAWTTTPWTLPSNTALAVGKNIEYVKLKTINQYTGKPICVYLAKDLMGKFFPNEEDKVAFEDYKTGGKKLPYEIISTHKGTELSGMQYEQLLPYAQPEDGDAFRVVVGDFVSTEDGTGIVHIAPSFGADDYFVGKQNGIGSLTMVDKQGKFIDCMGEFAGRYVKPEYDDDFDPDIDRPVDVDIIIKLKTENKAFTTEKYLHSYPHCWRTDKPILYYPLDSWFVKTTAIKDKLLEYNKKINWKPQSTGTGRFGSWLENLVDWNLSRSRYWGIPLPIWKTEDDTEIKCIGSVAELKAEIQKSVEAGYMEKNPFADFNPEDYSKKNYEKFDLHRPYADEIILVSKDGNKMFREPDLIDVWFDSGSMPYAQAHYPFENKDNFDKVFPADFIAEGVDQTRGWFFTLHAISTMLFDSIAFKNVISNGLVLDKNGNKMSKRLKNAVDPFDTINKYGADATRWYMITNAQPWDNLKFNTQGLIEVQRKFFGTLYNTYSFFALYANIDGFSYQEPDINLNDRPEIDRWILSELNTLIKQVGEAYEDYEPTKAGRLVQDFVYDYLSNWYVRLCRRRFWKGDYSEDKIAAYQTLYTCLETVAKLMAPIAPFMADELYQNLNNTSNKEPHKSIHLSYFPEFNSNMIDASLEERMQMAQKICSMVLSLRKKENIRVRQPLQKMIIPIVTEEYKTQIQKVENLILSEVNVKEVNYVTDTSNVIIKKVKPNFKTLGPRFGKAMKPITIEISKMNQEAINTIEKTGNYTLNINNEPVEISIDDVEIIYEDIPGWIVSSSNDITVAIDVNITDDLKAEGIARDFINRIQNLRKTKGLDVTDKIVITVEKQLFLEKALIANKTYICNETLTAELLFTEKLNVCPKNIETIEVENDVPIKLVLEKVK